MLYSCFNNKMKASYHLFLQPLEKASISNKNSGYSILYITWICCVCFIQVLHCFIQPTLIKRKPYARNCARSGNTAVTTVSSILTVTFNTVLIDLSSDYSEVAISTVTSNVHNNKDKKWLRKCKSDLDFALKGIFLDSWWDGGGGITRKGHQCLASD